LSRRRNRSDATLSVIGRDVEEQELALEFKPDMCLWSALGKADEIKRSGERQEIIDLLKQSGEPMTPASIASLLDKQPGAIRTLLWKMKSAGEIKIIGSKYQLPEYEHPELTKIRKPKKSQNITASPVMNLTGDASTSNGANGLEQIHHRITDIAHFGNGAGVQSGDAVMKTTQLLPVKDIDPSPLENITGDAGDVFNDPILNAIDQ
jgi:hypothetical protein